MPRAELVGIVCVGCGCTEDRACLVDGQPCAWATVNAEDGTGLCTACRDTPLEQLEARVEARLLAAQFGGAR